MHRFQEALDKLCPEVGRLDVAGGTEDDFMYVSGLHVRKSAEPNHLVDVDILWESDRAIFTVESSIHGELFIAMFDYQRPEGSLRTFVYIYIYIKHPLNGPKYIHLS